MTQPLSDKRTPDVHLLVSMPEAEALIEMSAALEKHMRDDSPFNTATIKMDEQLAAQHRP